ncbi:MAG: hypothetical protein LH702_07860 [Phormidesmis sp. CAN_BIN44]|nr:hypothetical protein [Phormidesmis sp. CAN_BIN44]
MDEEKTTGVGSQTWVDGRVAEINSITNNFEKAYALVKLASVLQPSPTEILQEALIAAQAIGRSDYKAEALSAIAPQLPESERKQVLQQALAAAQAIEHPYFKSYALSAIAPQLPESAPDLLQQALTAAQAIEDSSYKAEALNAIVPQLPESERKEVLQQALTAAQAIENSHTKVLALNAIAPRLPESEREGILQQALIVAQAIEDSSYKAEALSAITPRLPESEREGILQQALIAAQAIEYLISKTEALSAIAPQLPESERKQVLQQALAAAQAIEDAGNKVLALSAIAPQLPESQQKEILQQALNTAQVIEDPNRKAKVLITIAPQLPESQQKEVLQQALTAAQATENPYLTALALSAIALRLPTLVTDLLQQALTAAQAIEDSFKKAKALSAIAPRLPESKRKEVLQQALTAAQAIEDSGYKVEALSAIAPQLPESEIDLLQQALTAAQAIVRSFDKARALSAIAPRLPKSEREGILQQALIAAQASENPHIKVRALSAIALQLPEPERKEILQQALTVAQAIEDSSYKADALSAIALQLPEPERKEILQQALTAAQAIVRSFDKAQALSAIAQIIPSTSLKSFVEATLNLSEAAKPLVPLASRFTADFVLLIPANKHQVALDIVKHLPSDEDKTKFLSALISRLSPGRLPAVLKLIESEIKDDLFRAEILSNLVPYLSSAQFSEAITLIEDAIQNPHHRTSALEALTPFLDIDCFDAALELVETLPFPQHQVRVLSALAIALVTQAEQNESEPETQFYQVFCNRLIYSTISLDSTKRDDFSYERAVSDIFSQLAPILKYATETAQVNFFEAINNLTDPGYQAKLLIALAPNFPQQVSKLLKSYQGDDYRTLLKVKIQVALIDSSDTTAIKRIPDTLKTIQGSYYKTEALVEIARHPAGSRVRGLQTKALRAIGELAQNPYLQARYLQRLISNLEPRERIEAGNVINDIADSYYQVSARVALARKFPQTEIFNEALKEIGERDSNNKPELNRVQQIEQLSILAIDMPELLPRVIKLAESLHTDQQTTNSETANDKESETFSIKMERRDILLALAPHLPMRISREVNRELALGHFISRELYNRALYLLARGYRAALQGGTLRNDAAQDRDLLDLKEEINALSGLLLMRDLEPPMAVGILGGWGGGKSYIMHLMQARMTEIRSNPVDPVATWNINPNYEKLSPFVGHVYQIKFDAWTFAKSDLWASLMQTIFFELDRQLTLETQITEVLQSIENKDRQVIESKIWPVLYKSNDDERAWFLKRVLKDETTLNLLLDKQKEVRTGLLWEKFKESQTTAISNLDATEASLKTKKRELEELKASLRTQIRQDFEPIFNLSKNQSLQRVDALLGTSVILLRRRIGQTAFKELNTEISNQLFKSAPVSSKQSGGLWQQLEEKLAALDKAKSELEALTKSAEKATASDKSVATTKTQASEKAVADQVNAVEKTDQPTPNTQAKDTKTEIDQKRKKVNDLLREVSETKFDIFNLVANVIEKKQKWLDWHRNWKWLKSNWLLVLLFTLLFVVPVVLLATFDSNSSSSVNQQISKLVPKLAALIAPLLPGVVILQNLLKSGQKWFEETRLALHEYEKSVEKRNKDIEATYEQTVKDSLEVNPRLQQLEREVQALEKEYEEQKQTVPVNQYATLSEFISDRLEQGTYKNRLGLMQQVKQDLADLSNKLLPPSQYDESFQSKIDFLKKVFPRGPARVVVYIDDLDRCPPKRVVQVLEAVQLLVKTPLFIAVLAIDERYITRALEKFYEGVLSRRGRPSGTDYLEKIIQLPYRVRPIMANTLESYLRSQVVIQDSATGGAKFSEFSRQEFNMLLDCCKQVDLSPRTIKRLTNVYKLFKIVCRTRGTKLTLQVQQSILALLALSGRYPNLMRGIFDDIQSCFEEQRTHEKAEQFTRQQAEKTSPILNLKSPLLEFFENYRLPEGDRYLQREFDKLKHDALQTSILPSALTLDDMSHEIFNLIRSFSFVGEIGEDPEDYRFSGPEVNGQLGVSIRPVEELLAGGSEGN